MILCGLCYVSSNLITLWIVLMSSKGTSGHGRLVEPPSRSSMFRFGYNVPANYQDNQLFCGGFQVTLVEM